MSVWCIGTLCAEYIISGRLCWRRSLTGKNVDSRLGGQFSPPGMAWPERERAACGLTLPRSGSLFALTSPRLIGEDAHFVFFLLFYRSDPLLRTEYIRTSAPGQEAGFRRAGLIAPRPLFATGVRTAGSCMALSAVPALLAALSRRLSRHRVRAGASSIKLALARTVRSASGLRSQHGGRRRAKTPRRRGAWVLILRGGGAPTARFVLTESGGGSGDDDDGGEAAHDKIGRTVRAVSTTGKEVSRDGASVCSAGNGQQAQRQAPRSDPKEAAAKQTGWRGNLSTADWRSRHWHY